MTKRPVSIKQVADAAGVPTATVSNVCSGKKPVKPALAEHVREVASALGYRGGRRGGTRSRARDRDAGALA